MSDFASLILSNDICVCSESLVSPIQRVLGKVYSGVNMELDDKGVQYSGASPNGSIAGRGR